MAGRGQGQLTPLQGLASALSQTTSSINGFFDTWFGPWTPPPESAPTSEPGRRFDYATGWNIRRSPRIEEERATVAELRNLSLVDMVRIIIETRKDILSKAEWTIGPRRKPGETEAQARKRGKGDRRIVYLSKFLEYPDKERDYNTWARLLIEDALVLDAASLYGRRTRGGGVYSLDVIDGGTITRYLDPTGRTPQPPYAAYGQWIHGAPYKNYTTDRLLYYPRNPQPHLVYALSPVEQIQVITNVTLNRSLSQLAAYSVSNIPTMFIKSPKDWKPSDIKEFQVWFDSVLSGNIEERSKAFFIPDAADPVKPKEDVLADNTDEWFARVVCYCFGVAPNWFIKQQSRSSAESTWQQADEEGALPWLRWLKSFIDLAIARFFNMPDLEMKWVWERKPLPLQQSQIFSAYVKSGILTRDEVREELGYDPLTDEQKQMVQEQTATGGLGFPSARPEEEGSHRAAMDGSKPPRNPEGTVGGAKSVNSSVREN